MGLYEVIAVCLFIIPAALFLFIILASIVLRVAKIKLPEQVTTFFLKSYGWLEKGNTTYSNRHVRWGSGIVFTLSYGSILVPQLGLVLATPHLGNLLVFILTCLVAFCTFLIFAGSYYSGAAYNAEELIISPLRLADGIRLSNKEKELVSVRSLGSISLVYCPQWEQGRFVLLSKKQLYDALNTTV
ncbi:MAG: hypothetical protein ACERJ1_15600 [Halodesulfovibrio sp.]|uniref:hypothetical protein n=1 Tax=Halodesulfovibrio sp. TaxID=1912772 RepID=UPI00359DED11